MDPILLHWWVTASNCRISSNVGRLYSFRVSVPPGIDIVNYRVSHKSVFTCFFLNFLSFQYLYNRSLHHFWTAQEIQIPKLILLSLIKLQSKTWSKLIILILFKGGCQFEGQLSLSFLNQFSIFLCPSKSKFCEFSKTPPTFVF